MKKLITAIMILSLALSSGLSLAKSSKKSDKSDKHSGHSHSKSKHSHSKSKRSSRGGGGEKVLVCHVKGNGDIKEKMVSVRAESRHLNHGDPAAIDGSCSAPPETDACTESGPTQSPYTRMGLDNHWTFEVTGQVCASDPTSSIQIIVDDSNYNEVEITDLGDPFYAECMDGDEVDNSDYVTGEVNITFHCVVPEA